MIINSFRGEYSFLSNFHQCVINYDGLVFQDSESLFQSFKTEDLSEKRLFTTMTGSSAKRYGKRIQLRNNWNKLRNEFMYKTLVAKFTQNKYLSEKLLATGDGILVEGNTWGDRYWGVCGGQGENYLGLILMLVRKELKDGTLQCK